MTQPCVPIWMIMAFVAITAVSIVASKEIARRFALQWDRDREWSCGPFSIQSLASFYRQISDLLNVPNTLPTYKSSSEKRDQSDPLPGLWYAHTRIMPGRAGRSQKH